MAAGRSGQFWTVIRVISVQSERVWCSPWMVCKREVEMWSLDWGQGRGFRCRNW